MVVIVSVSRLALCKDSAHTFCGPCNLWHIPKMAISRTATIIVNHNQPPKPSDVYMIHRGIQHLEYVLYNFGAVWARSDISVDLATRGR
jgi:hypothetical protein